MPSAPPNEHVVLLHGLCRTTRSMEKIEQALRDAGYIVHNSSYPTREKTIDRLAEEHLAPLLEQEELKRAKKVHFVTHSLGGIVLRQHLKDHTPPNLGRIVMLGPPNGGSDLVDKIGHWRLFCAINGPAGSQLGTKGLPPELGPLGHDHAVIAGRASINWINSCMIPGPDDGKVAVSKTGLSDTTHHLTLFVTHPYLMKNRRVIRNVKHYLRSGKFGQ
ncbi:MAG: alpha/beta hydrolase [Verrucomicrobiota bacterium]